MPATLAPASCIVPIFRSSPDNPISQLLGTGFFVGAGDSLHLITAKHVFLDNPLVRDEAYRAAFVEGNSARLVPIPQAKVAEDFDVAACVLSASDFPMAVPLRVGRADPALNAEVLSYEYSGTRIEKPRPDHTHVSVEPSAHKGNVVRNYVSTFPEKTPTRSLLVSFPALQGASGAPLLTASESRNEFAVVGMLVANVEQHLLPAQIVKLEGVEETTSYFLPYGKALGREVLVQCLRGLRVPFDYAT